ncbi:MAG: hypothetical protein M0P55_03590 [Clostridiales bacterium]|nr:hypothetical protein [Clostridiales bacterium]
MPQITLEIDQSQIDAITRALEDREDHLRLTAVTAYAEGDIRQSRILLDDADRIQSARAEVCAAWNDQANKPIFEIRREKRTWKIKKHQS